MQCVTSYAYIEKVIVRVLYSSLVTSCVPLAVVGPDRGARLYNIRIAFFHSFPAKQPKALMRPKNLNLSHSLTVAANRCRRAP